MWFNITVMLKRICTSGEAVTEVKWKTGCLRIYKGSHDSRVFRPTRQSAFRKHQEPQTNQLRRGFMTRACSTCKSKVKTKKERKTKQMILSSWKVLICTVGSHILFIQTIKNKKKCCNQSHHNVICISTYFVQILRRSNTSGYMFLFLSASICISVSNSGSLRELLWQ